VLLSHGRVNTQYLAPPLDTPAHALKVARVTGVGMRRLLCWLLTDEARTVVTLLYLAPGFDSLVGFK
jgi:hypothetical protein